MNVIFFAAFSVWAMWAAEVPPPTPTPGPRVLFTWSKERRAAYTQPLTCVAVPQALFRKAEALLPEGLPTGARLATDWEKTLGVLLPDPPRGFKLLVLRGDRIVNEVFLQTPRAREFVTPPRLILGPGGDPVALADREGFAVYASGQLTALFPQAPSAQVVFFRGSVMWCPHPRGAWLRDARRTAAPPPLWLSAELDGSREEVILAADPNRAHHLWGDLWDIGDQALAPVPRPDGKFWLAGLFSGELALASAAGQILKRFFVPYALRTEEDDPEAVAKLLQDDGDAPELSAAGSRFTDATKAPPKVYASIVSPASRVFSFAGRRGRSLLLGTATQQPKRALLEVEDEETVRCWQFPPSLSRGDDLSAWSTTERLWLASPFGYVRWEDLDRLWYEGSKARNSEQQGRP
ncbi:MAG: hypothetical protein ACP5NF_11955 [Thermoanaerobaculum sp.]